MSLETTYYLFLVSFSWYAHCFGHKQMTMPIVAQPRQCSEVRRGVSYADARVNVSVQKWSLQTARCHASEIHWPPRA
ncbi:uncharacterized protein F5Z01DRAFT_189720 [Emericellopsis atlantica]|uniref:Uncharacterized protein n=1 Tax=Emericellopsis atlantica TaxID=2614577 RepID=A0A9P8CNB2_9HYPO|nr:uncharacterized protein F5Z01DRAFT_189720 [Emericellopsis atlantica]KAG9252885.1 hypothetical protein F5Z01DRAFT_189720 [Emericellopsis atlantica]